MGFARLRHFNGFELSLLIWVPTSGAVQCTGGCVFHHTLDLLLSTRFLLYQGFSSVSGVLLFWQDVGAFG